jgi:hypothetical protein
MTGGEVPCQHDHSKTRLIQSGYLPIHHESGKRYFISLMEYSRGAVDRLTLWSEVMILRGSEERGPVTIVQKPGVHLWPRRHQEPLRGNDITEALLTLWKDEALARWCRANPAPAQDTAPPPPPPPPIYTPDMEREASAALVARSLNTPAAPVSEALGEVFRKRGIQTPSKNGTHD